MRNLFRGLLGAALGLGLLTGLPSTPPALAEPVTGQVLDKVTVLRQPECFGIVITFNFPLQYISHFPPERADLLRIRLKPTLSGSEVTDIYNFRESARPSHTHGSPLVDVTYEGDAIDPHLIVQFTHPVTYTLQPGADFRSLTIQVHASAQDDAQPCLPGMDPAAGMSP